MSTVAIPLTGGGHTLVDSDVARRLGTRRVWRAARRYVQIYRNGRNMYLHRFILDAPPDKQVDHKNGDTLDNRRENLRLVSRATNNRNQHAPPRSISGYRAVHWCRAEGRWRIRLRFDGHFVDYGKRWRSGHVAGLFADAVLQSVIGPFARRNFARTIPRARVCRFIAETNGRLFRVVFSKRSDGSQRIMTCRTGVTSHSKGGPLLFCPCLRGLALVWDVHKRAYRTIPVDRVIAIKFAKINYRIEGNHDHAYAQTRRAA